MTQLSSGVTHWGQGGKVKSEKKYRMEKLSQGQTMANHSMPDNRYQNGEKIGQKNVTFIGEVYIKTCK